MKHKLLYFLPLVALLTACGTPKNTTYFQDTAENTLLQMAKQEDIRMKPGDKLFIMVNSKDPNLTTLFNLPYITRQIGSNTNNTSSQTYGRNGLAGYTVDKQGDIDFPVVGHIKVQGLTREEVAQKVQDILRKQNLANDAVVTVEFQNLSVSVLGEVAHPGRFPIDRDNVTVLDALGLAGDLTINGQRENVMVIRNENGQKHTYVLDLTSAEKTFNSPAFYLQQEDIVYVEPNDTRKRQSTVNGNSLRSASMWISIASLLTSIAVFIFR